MYGTFLILSGGLYKGTAPSWKRPRMQTSVYHSLFSELQNSVVGISRRVNSLAWNPRLMLNCIPESKLLLLFSTPKPWVFHEGNAVFPSFQEQIFCGTQQAMWSLVTLVPANGCRLSVSLVQEWSLSQELPTGWALKLLVEKGTAEKQTSGMLKKPLLYWEVSFHFQ